MSESVENGENEEKESPENRDITGDQGVTEEQEASEEQVASEKQETNEEQEIPEENDALENNESIEEKEMGGDSEKDSKRKNKLLKKMKLPKMWHKSSKKDEVLDELESEILSEANTLHLDDPEGKSPKLTELKEGIEDDELKQLEKYEKEAKKTANAIYELKTRIEELSQKIDLTQEEAQELEQKNAELEEQMILFQNQTKQIEDLIANTSVVDDITERRPQVEYEEDILPKMILLGMLDEDAPKIVMCTQKNKGIGSKYTCKLGCPGPSPIPETFSSKLGETCLPEENCELDEIKKRLEEDISNKNELIQDLECKLNALQIEIRMVSAENVTLKEKVRDIEQYQRIQQKEFQKQQRKLPQATKMCPGVIQAKLQEYSNYTRKLEQQLIVMEEDCEKTQKEICAAQKERDRLKNNYNLVGSSSCQKRCR